MRYNAFMSINKERKHKQVKRFKRIKERGFNNENRKKDR